MANKMLKHSLPAVLVLAGSVALVACGDDSGNSSVTKKDSEVNDYKDLPECKLKNDAEKVTVDGEDAVYVCKDGNWEILDTNFVANDSAETLDDIPNCAKDQAGNSFYIESSGVNYICEDGRWEIVVVKTEDAKSSSSTAKSSASTPKSSESTASKPKSSASTGKSSASTSKPSESVVSSSASTSKSSNSTGKSSASTSKSSNSTGKSSASTSKSSNSTGKSSASTSKSSNSTGKSSSSKTPVSSASEDVVASLDDIPNCTAKREGKIYFVTEDNAYYQCFVSRSWIKVESCGKLTIATDAYFCVDEKFYEKCGGQSYDPTTEFCADNKTPAKLCNGMDYDVDVWECVDGSLGYKTIVDSIIEMQYGTFYFYTINNTAYMEVKYMGDATNPAKGTSCYEEGSEFAEIMMGNIEDAKALDMSTVSSDEERPVVAFFRGASIKVELDSCDYFSRVLLQNAYTDEFKHEDFKNLIKLVENMMSGGRGFTPYVAQEGDNKNCVSSESVSTLIDVETQFCYKGVAYDRCGGSTFSTSKPYDVEEYTCKDGEVVEKSSSPEPENKCGSVPYDPETELCFADKKYYKSKVTECKDASDKTTAIAEKGVEFCFDGASYANNDYEACYNGANINAIAEKGKEFCFKGNAYATDAYEKCSEYRIAELDKNEFCFEGDVYSSTEYEKCSLNSIADFSKNEFCFEGFVFSSDEYEKCSETVVASLSLEFCFKGEKYLREKWGVCGDDKYQKATQFCVDDKSVYDLCSGKTYTPQLGGKCTEGSYYYTSEGNSYFEDLRDHKSYIYKAVGDDKTFWMASDLIYARSGIAGIDDKSRLYTGSEIASACPAGWSVPDVDDYYAVIAGYGYDSSCSTDRSCSFSVGGQVLKSKSGWNSHNGDDSYDLSFRPTGLASSEDKDVGTKQNGYWWTSTSKEDGLKIVLALKGSDDGAVLSYLTSSWYYALRCIRKE